VAKPKAQGQAMTRTPIKIFNAKGLLIREEKIENIKGKINEVVWDGKDENGNSVSAGVYFYYQNT